MSCLFQPVLSVSICVIPRSNVREVIAFANVGGKIVKLCRFWRMWSTLRSFSRGQFAYRPPIARKACRAALVVAQIQKGHRFTPSSNFCSSASARRPEPARSGKRPANSRENHNCRPPAIYPANSSRMARACRLHRLCPYPLVQWQIARTVPVRTLRSAVVAKEKHQGAFRPVPFHARLRAPRRPRRPAG